MFNCNRIITGHLLAHRFKALNPPSRRFPSSVPASCAKTGTSAPAACGEGPSEQIMSFAGLGRSRPLSHSLPLWFHPLTATHQHKKRSQLAALGHGLVLTGRRLQLEAGCEGIRGGVLPRGLRGRGWPPTGLFRVGRGGELFAQMEVKTRREVPWQCAVWSRFSPCPPTGSVAHGRWSPWGWGGSRVGAQLRIWGDGTLTSPRLQSEER